MSILDLAPTVLVRLHMELGTETDIPDATDRFESPVKFGQLNSTQRTKRNLVQLCSLRTQLGAIG